MLTTLSPFDVATLAKVVKQASADLGCDEEARNAIAVRVLAYAANGEIDFDRLLAIVVQQGGVNGKNSFNPDDQLLTKVVDEACRRVGSIDDVTKEVLALRIRAYVAEGERDFDRLLVFALGGGLVNAA